MVFKGERKKLYNAEHYLKNKHKMDKEKKRNSHLKIRYGIDIDKYNLLLESQNYKCAICGSKETGRIDIKYFNVDHCHKTGKIRGLLCHSCNRMLGDSKDDPNILSKGIDYLKG